MKTSTYFKKLNPIFIVGSLTFLISSCGTYNIKNYDESDGIYSSNNTVVVENDVVENDVMENETKNNYYKQYFQTKSLDYQNLPDDNTILTDVDAYHSKDTLDAEGYVITEKRDYISEFDEEYGAWGNNSTQVSINVYGGYNYAPIYGGWNIGFGWGWGYPYYWGGYYPYYGYGWGNPYFWGGYYPYHGYGGYYSYANNRGRSNYSYTMARTYNRGRSNNYYSSRGTNNYNQRGNYRNQNSNYSRSQSSRRSKPNIGNVKPSTKPRYQGNSNNRNYSKRNYKPSKPSTNTRPIPSSKPSSSYRGGSTRSGGSYGGGSRGGGSRGGSGRRGGLK